jgi:hypothetical protein
MSNVKSQVLPSESSKEFFKRIFFRDNATFVQFIVNFLSLDSFKEFLENHLFMKTLT